ncbi:MAG TPA: glutathione S-transferase N-terminal domain-containing protein [Gammaproteobacteria bacterium]|nr:glutathione S-transferase N-terminal domain-containing protein [Gammaproteobacteria bacterium]
MSIVANRRSAMTLFSRPNCPNSHRTRFVLAEKGISYDVVNVVGNELPEDLIDLNPYHSIPTLVDRDLVLYDARIIMEYLDERFPHPPLMPVDPVSRARFRLALYRIERDWYSLIDQIDAASDRGTANRLKKMLKESVLATSDAFNIKPYFMSDEFSLVDCSIVPVLWRLQYYGIEIPAQAKAMSRYAERMFARPSFKHSLSEIEREMRK